MTVDPLIGDVVISELAEAAATPDMAKIESAAKKLAKRVIFTQISFLAKR